MILHPLLPISLVTDCLEVLNCILPRPLAVQVHLTYYTLTQSRPSCDEEDEFDWFSDCMLDLLGCPTGGKAKVMLRHRGITVQQSI